MLRELKNKDVLAPIIEKVEKQIEPNDLKKLKNGRNGINIGCLKASKNIK